MRVWYLLGFLNKIGGLAAIALSVGAVALAWQKHASAPEIAFLILGGLCVLAIAFAIGSLAFAAHARQETSKLSLLVEHAVDRLEQRHDSDHARLVMTLAALDARAGNSFSSEGTPKNANIVKDIAIPLVSTQQKKSALSTAPQKIGVNAAALTTALKAPTLPLSLEPIFEMPSADIRGYLAYCHIDERDIRRPAAGPTAIRIDFDYKLLFAAAKAVRQVLANVPSQSRLFCSISGASLENANAVDAILGLFGAQQELREHLHLLVDAQDLTSATSPVLERLRRADIRIAIEGFPQTAESIRFCAKGFWLVDAEDIAALRMTEFSHKYQELISNFAIELIALEGGDEAELVELIDRNIHLVTSRHLSPPRLVRER